MLTKAKLRILQWWKHLSGDNLSHQEFLPLAAEIVETPPSPIKLLLLISICAMLTLALGVSWFSKIDIYAVAPGRIQPTGRSKIVQPMATGRVRVLSISNGSHVHVGDILLELDPTEAGADEQASSLQVDAYDAEIARRQAAIEAARARKLEPVPSLSFPMRLDKGLAFRAQEVLAADLKKLHSEVQLRQSKISEDAAKKSTYESTLRAHQALLSTMRERVEMRENLQRDGWESRASVLDARESLEKEAAEVASDEGQLIQVRAEIATLQRQVTDTLARFIADNVEALETAEAKRNQNAQELIRASAKLRYTRLTSPISGTVQELAVTTIGQVVSPGEQLMTVVPDRASLEIEALIPEQDIGFIKVGQEAVVKVNAFPYTRFGTIAGTVTRISHDAVARTEAQQAADTQRRPISAQGSAASPTTRTQDLVFPVTLVLDRSKILVDGTDVPLSSGMAVSVEIKTGQRRVIDYLLSPLKEVSSETAHER